LRSREGAGKMKTRRRTPPHRASGRRDFTSIIYRVLAYLRRPAFFLPPPFLGVLFLAVPFFAALGFPPFFAAAFLAPPRLAAFLAGALLAAFFAPPFAAACLGAAFLAVAFLGAALLLAFC